MHDLAIDLTRRATIITSALKSAFGGWSQVTPEDIGRAVAGQINNNGLTVHGTLEEVCVAVVDAFDGDHDIAPDAEMPIDRVVGACRATLDELGVDYSRLPYPVARTGGY